MAATPPWGIAYFSRVITGSWNLNRVCLTIAKCWELWNLSPIVSLRELINESVEMAGDRKDGVVCTWSLELIIPHYLVSKRHRTTLRFPSSRRDQRAWNSEPAFLGKAGEDRERLLGWLSGSLRQTQCHWACNSTSNVLTIEPIF